MKVGLWGQREIVMIGIKSLIERTGNEVVFITTTDEPVKVIERHCEILAVALEPWTLSMVEQKLEVLHAISSRPVVMFISERVGSFRVFHLMERGVVGIISIGASLEVLQTALNATKAKNTYFDHSVARFDMTLIMENLKRKSRSNTTSDRVPLTSREREVWQAVAEATPTKDAAHILGMSIKTFEVHKTNLMRKLEVHSKADLILLAIKRGIIICDAEEIPEPVTRVSALSNREQEIQSLVIDGFNDEEIARKLSINESTLYSHLKHIFEKTGTRDRSELIRRSVQ